MFCSRCGAALTSDSNFCAGCGKPASTAVAQPPAPNNYPSVPVSMKRPGVVTLIAALDLFFGSLYLLAIVAMVFSLEAREWNAASVIIVAILGVVGGVTLAAGIGLLMMKEYGRITQLVISSIGLLGFPLGTIISALILYYLTRPGIRVLFSGKSTEQLTPDEVASIAQLQSSGGAGIVLAVAIGLLVIIGFMGIMAAIAIPNLLTAMQRSKQKRTMADMRTVATAMEAYATDYNTYAPGNWHAAADESLLVASDEVRLDPGVRVDLDALSKVLVPTYMTTMPHVDGWNREFEVYVGHRGEEYAIRSLAKDGVAESETYRPGTTTNFDCDIVYAMGQFVAYPEGSFVLKRPR